MSKTIQPRRGIAVTEMAVCLPVLLIALMCTLELCTMIRLRQKLKTTAFEGARVGLLPDAKSDNVNWQCQVLCQSNGIVDFVVSSNPADPSALKSGDWFTVSLEAPFASNSLTGGWGMADKNVSESVTLQCP